MYNIRTHMRETERTMLQTRTENFPIRTVSEITGVNAVTLRAGDGVNLSAQVKIDAVSGHGLPEGRPAGVDRSGDGQRGGGRRVERTDVPDTGAVVVAALAGGGVVERYAGGQRERIVDHDRGGIRRPVVGHRHRIRQ